MSLVVALDGELVGKLRLYKAFYKAHLLYFDETGLELTGYPIVHMPNGPGIDNAQELIDELRHEGLVREKIGTEDYDDERVYSLIGQAPVEEDEDKARIIRDAALWAKALSGKQLKDASHLRSWEESSSGRIQNIFVDLLSEEKVEEIRADARARMAKLKKLVPDL